MTDDTDSRGADWLTDIADLAGSEQEGAELRAMLAARFDSAAEVERAAAEVEVARRVRRLMLSLRAAEVEVPANFEARLLERVRGDQTLLDLLELHLSGFGSVLVELINALFSFLPEAPRPHHGTA
jgi:hypothetical protein